jgi:hypothetical protein
MPNGTKPVAIIEFEGKVSRDEAERSALAIALEKEHLN